MLCHGNGNSDLVRAGCCYVSGQVCPLRLRITDGHVWDHQDNDLGTVDGFITTYFKGKANQDRARAQLEGVVFVCRAAVEVIANNSKLLNDRPALNDAWNAHADYVALVRPHWAAIEQRLGLAEGSYQCSTWRGTGVPQCCFTEDQETNDAKAAGLSTDARTVRQAGGQ